METIPSSLPARGPLSSWLVIPAILLIAAAALRFAYGRWTAPDAAMYPGYPTGASVWARKEGEGRALDVRRGEVVVIRSGSLARVVGLAGERIAIRVDRVMLNGQELPLRVLRHEGEFTIFEETAPESTPGARPSGNRIRYEIALPKEITNPGGGDVAEVKVPPGHVFVLGDNRRHAPHDSRATGPIPFDAILGRVASPPSE